MRYKYLFVLGPILIILLSFYAYSIASTFTVGSSVSMGALESASPTHSVRIFFLNSTTSPVQVNFTTLGQRQPSIDIRGHTPASQLQFNNSKTSVQTGVWNVITSTQPTVTGGATATYISANSTLRLTWSSNATVTLSWAGGAITRSISDTLTLSETLTRLLVLGRSLTDTITLSDSIQRAGVVARSIADTLTISDTLSRLLIFSRSITDSLEVAFSIASSVVGATPSAPSAGGFFIQPRSPVRIGLPPVTIKQLTGEDQTYLFYLIWTVIIVFIISVIALAIRSKDKLKKEFDTFSDFS